jgi:hypothetical protein
MEEQKRLLDTLIDLSNMEARLKEPMNNFWHSDASKSLLEYEGLAIVVVVVVVVALSGGMSFLRYLSEALNEYQVGYIDLL